MRLLVISNRLPVTVIEKEGKLKFRESAGGLVSGLSAYLDSLKGVEFTKAEYIWVGWPGAEIAEKAREKVIQELYTKFHSYPVFLSKNAMENFYYGFCNKTIWPLFHYFPSYAVYNENFWNCYKQVNESFCQSVLQIARPDDIIWIHDYHLMLLPKLIREKMPKTSIGFFMHIPFPSYEIFRLLPKKWRYELLTGLLGADLIGFHTHDYSQYFLRCVFRILGYEHNMGQIFVEDRIVKVDTFPMGIDFNKYSSAAENTEVKNEIEKLQKTLKGLKIILSVDRLDYTKGIINRLQGFEMFLERNPNWHRKIVLILITVPSRIGVEHYQQIKHNIDELVGRINGRFGTIGWTPILYQYRYLPFHSLCALYNISDIALITPLRDGMNLIAKEYIATKVEKPGVLILSEMAGASKELGESIIINPNNREEIAEALEEALEIPEEEQIKRNKIMQNRLQSYNVTRWAEDFIQQLHSVKAAQEKFNAKLLTTSLRDQLISDFKKAAKKIILLDYDGTLVPFVPYPETAKPPETLLNLIDKISEISGTEIVIISGRDKETIQNWFGRLNIGLAAEHGVWIREKTKNWTLIKQLSSEWKQQLLPIFKIYVDRLPGSFIEEKQFSIVWHYRRADPELASVRSKELMDDLVHFTANTDIQVLQGNKIVEVRCAGVNKGSASMYFLSKDEFEFVLAIGDDWTDEDMFKVLPERAYSIKVGLSPSYAKFNLLNYREVVQLLEQLKKV